MINKVAVASANLNDVKGLSIYAQVKELYTWCIAPAKRISFQKGVHLAAIRLNNMKNKNEDQE